MIPPERAQRAHAVDVVQEERREKQEEELVEIGEKEEEEERENIPIGPVHISTKKNEDYVGFSGRASDLQCAVPNYMLNFH